MLNHVNHVNVDLPFNADSSCSEYRRKRNIINYHMHDRDKDFCSQSSGLHYVMQLPLKGAEAFH